MISMDTVTLTRELSSPVLTEAFALGVGDLLIPGDVLLLKGDLGAGKTTFTRGVAKALGIPASQVSSPTFVVMNIYTRAEGKPSSSPNPLIHVDAYRIRSVEELENIGWDRVFEMPTGQVKGRGVALIEWPERLEGALPSVAATLHLVSSGESSRDATLTVPRAWANRPAWPLLVERAPRACPVTKRAVSPTNSAYPFFDDRSRDADLFGWLTESYRSEREMTAEDDHEKS